MSDTPLSDPVLRILLALADGPGHGYGILQEVEARGGRMGTGTLYTAIKRLRGDGWIEETDAPDGADDDPRRRYYRLTREGRGVLASEARRLEALVAQARSKAVLPAGGT